MLSQTAEYALRATACLAAAPVGVLVPTTLLADQTQVPVNYLAKVLQQLASARIVTGRRGVGGGYRLARPAAEITLLEVIDAVGPIRRIQGCPAGVPGHERLGMVQKQANQAIEAVIGVFGSVRLDQLVDGPGALRTGEVITRPVEAIPGVPLPNVTAS